jgi:hypothetical protein
LIGREGEGLLRRVGPHNAYELQNLMFLAKGAEGFGSVFKEGFCVSRVNDYRC